MTVAWTPPEHVTGGDGMPASDFDEQVIDNLQFLWNGVAQFVGGSQDCSAQVVPTANRALLCPFVPKDQITIAGLTYRNGTSTGNIDVGVYVDNGNGTTADRLKSSGSTAMPAVGNVANTLNFTANQTLDPYVKYWFAICFSSGSARVLGTDGAYSLLCKLMVSAFPLPATVTFGATATISPCLAGLPV